MNHLISVIVPAYNAEKAIQQTLRALLLQDFQGTYEIIVVDDGSTDATASIIRSFPSIKYFSQKNAGPASARNRGAREAEGEIVLFTDSDCVPRKKWITNITKSFMHEQIGAVMGSYGIANPEFILSRVIHAEIMFRHEKLMPLYPKVFGSYNVAIRKKIFEQVGGFDVSYPAASGEDNDLSYKILKAGYKIFFAKDALVNHYHTTNLKKYLREQFRHGFFRAKMYREHPHMVKGDDYTFWKDVVEMPLAGLTVLGLPVAFVKFSLGLKFFFFGCILLWLMEFLFSLTILKSLSERFFLSFVMFLRSFARLFGISSGFLRFFAKK